jgi:hypothetical protein
LGLRPGFFLILPVVAGGEWVVSVGSIVRLKECGWAGRKWEMKKCFSLFSPGNRKRLIQTPPTQLISIFYSDKRRVESLLTCTADDSLQKKSVFKSVIEYQAHCLLIK